MTFTSGQVLTAAQLNDLDIDSLTVDTNVLVVDKTNNRVGVNTASPGYDLSVGTPSGNASVQIMAASGAYPQLFFGDGGTNQWHIESTPSGGALYFVETGVGYPMTFLPGNKVGIGTTNPETSLNIASANRLGSTFTGTTDGEGLRVDQTNYTDGNYVSLVEASYNDAQTEPHVRIGAQFTGSGSKLVFGTSNAYGSGITNAALTIDPSGILVTSNEIQVDGGSVTDPAYTFVGDSNTGFFSAGNTGYTAWTGNGTEGGRLYSTGVRTVDGSNTNPSYSFSSDPDTGMYRVTTDQVGFSAGGTLKGRFWSQGLLMGSASTGNAQLGTGTGSAGAPVYHFYNDTDTGMYRSAENELSFATAGIRRHYISSGGTFIWVNSSGLAGPLITTTSTTNFHYVMQSDLFGTFYKFSSLRASKEQITNVTAEDSGRWIDALQPVTYVSRWLGEGDEPSDARTWRLADMQVGFIADDILANADTDHFSQVSDDGEGGLDPAGWKWECVIAAAVAEIKSLRARVAALEP